MNDSCGNRGCKSCPVCADCPDVGLGLCEYCIGDCVTDCDEYRQRSTIDNGFSIEFDPDDTGGDDDL